MIEYIFMITTILGAIICLMQRDLLKAAILTGIPGASLAFLYQYLQAPDVALIIALLVLNEPLMASAYLILAPFASHAIANGYYYGEEEQ